MWRVYKKVYIVSIVQLSLTCYSVAETDDPGWKQFARLRTFTWYCRDITFELRPVCSREIAFRRLNSLKFARELARNSFSRFEGVNHGHTPGLA